MIHKISDAFAPLKQIEDKDTPEHEEKFWNDLNELKLPLYLIMEDSK